MSAVCDLPDVRLDVSARSTVADVGDAAPALDTWQLAEAAIDLATGLCGVQAVALFALAERGPRLVASRGLTQAALAAVRLACARARKTLEGGIPHTPEIPVGLVIPCSDELGLAGVAYVEGETASGAAVWPLLVPLSQLLASVLRGPLAAAVALPGAARKNAADAAALYVVMERHEWNVSRVARALAVTRQTVYDRLRRCGLERRRVVKAERRRSKPASRFLARAAAAAARS